jgi:hypothetical protein
MRLRLTKHLLDVLVRMPAARPAHTLSVAYGMPYRKALVEVDVYPSGGGRLVDQLVERVRRLTGGW